MSERIDDAPDVGYEHAVAQFERARIAVDSDIECKGGEAVIGGMRRVVLRTVVLADDVNRFAARCARHALVVGNAASVRIGEPSGFDHETRALLDFRRQ